MNKASRGDEIPVEIFQKMKDAAVIALHLILQQIWKTQQWPQDQKSSVFIPIPKKEKAKECSLLHNCTHLTCQQSNAQISSSQASTVRELRTSRCSSWIQKRQRNQRSNCQHPLDHRKSKRVPEKLTYLPIDLGWGGWERQDLYCLSLGISHTVHGVLKARIPKGFAIPFSN